MSQLGIGVMIGMLGGNKPTVDAWHASKGKEIAKIELIKDYETGEILADVVDVLMFTFTDGSQLGLYDGGQSCCEHRWMEVQHDNLDQFIGATLDNVEERDGTSTEGEWETKDTTFVWFTTSKGQFNVANYNEHNGYYGGFLIRLFDPNKKED